MKNHKGEEKKAHAAHAPEKAECAAGPEAKAEESELEKQTRLAADYYNQLLRLQADFENYRKRLDKEKPELIRWGKAELLLKLLPLYDLLIAAHAHINTAKENGGGDQTLKGLEMIFKEFSKVFDSEGLRPMEPVGKPYDPMASEILGVVEGTEENDGLVVEELQKGFYFCDKILRPARVKIAKKKAASVSAAAAEQPPAQAGEAVEEGQ
ncbi:MAG TPA: nucleotide exchange factor GrpE [Elusimicrobiales bacterium]|nr:nucleotide exchange factor GrpE [Elusimicrobiales bacterium]